MIAIQVLRNNNKRLHNFLLKQTSFTIQNGAGGSGKKLLKFMDNVSLSKYKDQFLFWLAKTPRRIYSRQKAPFFQFREEERLKLLSSKKYQV